MPSKKTDDDNQEVERQHPGRRKLIKALGVGGTGVLLSQEWAKPVVDSVVLPLHAQASPLPQTVTYNFSGTVTGITAYLNGCRRVIVQPRVGKDGKVPDSQYVDEPQLTVVKKRVVKTGSRETGGPISVPADNRDPKR